MNTLPCVTDEESKSQGTQLASGDEHGDRSSCFGWLQPGRAGGRWLRPRPASGPSSCRLPRGHPWAGCDGRLALPGSRPGARVGDAPDSRGCRVSLRRAWGLGTRDRDRRRMGWGCSLRPVRACGVQGAGCGACGSQEFPLVCGEFRDDLREGQHCSRSKCFVPGQRQLGTPSTVEDSAGNSVREVVKVACAWGEGDVLIKSYRNSSNSACVCVWMHNVPFALT